MSTARERTTSVEPLPIQVGPAAITINRNDRFVVCQPDGRILDAAAEGFFARDTRVVSGWDLLVNGRRPVLLNSSPIQFFSSRFEFTNPPLVDDRGPISASSVSIRVDRTLSEGVHEDYTLVNYSRRAVRLTLELEINSDFADIFEVKTGDIVRRGEINSRWYRSRRELRTSYVNSVFRQELILQVDRADSPPQFANGRLAFVALIQPKRTWHTCIKWLPVFDGGRRPTTLGCNAIAAPFPAIGRARLPTPDLEAANAPVVRAWEQANRDLEGLRLEDPALGRGTVIPAAGVPWFVTLFGRDALIVSLQTLSAHPEFAAGAIRRLSALQATEDDPERDMEPGKIPHEVRHGELTRMGILPYTPYYGTADATSLFVIVLSELYHWLGHAAIVRRYLPNVEAAMAWVDHHGDLDGDGLQEYRTRSSHGYYNQAWKDAGDAIVHADGSLAPLALAVCELQGYAYDAKLRLAELYEVLERPKDARRLRAQARRLYERVNEAFWWEDEGTYYLGLDGAKKPIRSIASNAGHLLFSGIVPQERAGRVVKRLLEDDMWSGWGIRTLSSEHVAYNPFSYHTGTVWPHDNAICAAGFQRYGFHAEAAKVARAVFDTAERFQANRLPELFAGLAREGSAFPVQYLGANVPQAWAAGCVIQLLAMLSGVEAHSSADGSQLRVAPALPEWLPEVTLSNLRVGRGAVTLRISNSAVDVLSNTSGFDVVRGPSAAGAAPATRKGH